MKQSQTPAHVRRRDERATRGDKDVAERSTGREAWRVNGDKTNEINKGGSARMAAPDFLLKRGDAFLQRADLAVLLSHCVDQVAVRLLGLLQQLVGCRQL